MKHINEFDKFTKQNENMWVLIGSNVVLGIVLYRLIKGILSKFFFNRKYEKTKISLINKFLGELKNMREIPVAEFNDRYYVRLDANGVQIDLRLMKNEKLLTIDLNNKGAIRIDLSEKEYNEFINLFTK